MAERVLLDLAPFCRPWRRPQMNMKREAGGKRGLEPTGGKRRRQGDRRRPTRKNSDDFAHHSRPPTASSGQPQWEGARWRLASDWPGSDARFPGLLYDASHVDSLYPALVRPTRVPIFQRCPRRCPPRPSLSLSYPPSTRHVAQRPRIRRPPRSPGSKPTLPDPELAHSPSCQRSATTLSAGFPKVSQRVSDPTTCARRVS